MSSSRATVRHFLVDTDLTPLEQASLLDAADAMKAARRAAGAAGAAGGAVGAVGAGSAGALAGRSVALLFEAPSTPTRVSFDVAVAELGGHCVVLDTALTTRGRGETAEDTAAALSRYVDVIVAATLDQDQLERMAAAATVPVVNAQSGFAHPCQALADLQTVRECTGRLAGLRLAYLGDGNNVAHSLLLAGALAGMRVHVASPPGYEPFEQVVRHANEVAAATGGAVAVTHDVFEAASDADVLYTDVWTTAARDGEAVSRSFVLQPYRLDEKVVEAAKDDVVIMHCLPVHRDVEIAASILDGPRSVVFDQAENRVHAQKALLAFLLDPPPPAAVAPPAPKARR